MKTGSVPTAVVGPVIAQLIEERWPARRRPEGEEWGVSILAEKVGCHPDALDAIIRQKSEGVGFDFVDKILCALGRPDIWIGALADVYNDIVFMSGCALSGCNRSFRESSRGRHGPKRYCCARHAKHAYDVRKGASTGQFLRKRGYCLKGHKMTPENSKRNTDGKVQCRTCDNARRRERRRENLERERAYQREWSRKKRAARAA